MSPVYALGIAAAAALAVGGVASCAAIGGLGDLHEVDCVGDCDGGASSEAGGDALDNDSDKPPQPFGSIGGTVTGLVGTGLVLKDNGADDLQVSSNGPFSFPAAVKSGGPYAVTISSQPTSPTQVCSVGNGSGTVQGADVTNVAVTCSTSAYAIGGIVVGLSGTGLVLTDNGGDALPVAANGKFTFATKVASGSPFAVAVKTQPSTSGPCVVSGASGTVGLADVTGVVVNCAPGTYTVGGTVAGLNGTVVLQDNGGANLSVNANGTFAFAQTLTPGAPYAVTVLTPPSYPPRSQTCAVSGGSGLIANANVTNVGVSCTTNAFKVGGNVAGLSGTVVLKDNGGDALTVSASGAFSFATPVTSGNTYAVTIATQPAGQTCTLANASGTVANGAVSNVSVNCGTAGDPGIRCGGTFCDPTTSLCCVTNGVPACAAKCTGGGTTPISCDDAHDCTNGLVCCGSVTGTVVNNIFCSSAAQCQSPKAYYCDPTIANPCPNGGTCDATNVPSGFFRCF
jgi:hypothetical protein